jgi:NitT/TauT family transport system permease protein
MRWPRPDPEFWFQTVRLLSPLVLLAVWELTAWAGWIDVRFFPPPSTIFGSLREMAVGGELWPHLRDTLWRLSLGFLAGGIPAVALGLGMGLLPWLRAAVDPVIAALHPIPKSAILPLLLLIFGLGEGSRITMVAIGVFFIVVVNAMEGVLTIHRVYIDVARSFGATWLQMVRTVALPGSLPLVLAGIRMGLGLGFILGVVAEMLGARSGLGYVLWRSWQTFDVPTVYGMLIVSAVIGYLTVVVMDWVRRTLVPWQS